MFATTWTGRAVGKRLNDVCLRKSLFPSNPGGCPDLCPVRGHRCGPGGAARGGQGAAYLVRDNERGRFPGSLPGGVSVLPFGDRKKEPRAAGDADVYRGIGGDEEPAAPSDFPYHWITYCGAEIKKHVNIPVIAVYHIRTPEEARWLVENAVDFVAVGKGMPADHDWAKKAQSGQEIQ